MKGIAIIAFAAVSSLSFGQLWDQSQLTNVVGGGTGAIAGQNLSMLETTPNAENIFGFGAQTTSNNVMADDFTVGPNGWNVTALRFYTYQTGATAPSITGMSWAIDSTLTSTAVTSSAFTVSFTNIFRVNAGDTGSTGGLRQIQQVDVTGLNLNLAAGTYFLKWNFAGSLASGPWAPALPTSLATHGMNVQQSLANAPFAPGVNGTMGADGAFQVLGTENVPEPATMGLLALGAAFVARRRKNNK